METHKKILIAIVFSCLYLAAQTALAAREYLVELVVFTNLGAQSKESWHNTYPPLDTGKMDRAVLPTTIMPPVTAGKPGIREIEDSNFNAYVDRIRRDDRKKILVDTRWVQEVSGPAQTTIVRITDEQVPGDTSMNDKAPASGNRFPDRAAVTRSTDSAWNEKPPVLDGFINFFLDEYYALETDLRYTPPYRPSILDENTTGGPTTYRIHEQRKMKSGELNYYDHPHFGMVLLVTPVKTVEEPTLKQPGDSDQRGNGNAQGTL